MSENENHIRLQHMLDAAYKIIEFTKDETRASLDTDEKLLLALVRLIEIIGEAATRIPREFHTEHPEIKWPEMIAMRNRLIHGYFDINHTIVWNTVSITIPELIVQLEALLSDNDVP